MLERAGISRADMVIAVTGDDEDNMLICQVAREKYLVDRIIARVNNPRNREWFELLGIKPYVSATDLILRLLEHEVPGHGLVHLLDLPEERLEIIEMLLSDDSRAAGERVGDLHMPDGSLLISVLREGEGFVPGPEPCWRRATRCWPCSTRGSRRTSRSSSGPTARRPTSVASRRVASREVGFLLIGGGMASAYCAAELRARGPRGRSCWWGASRSRRMSGRRCRRSTCAGRPSARTPT